MPQVPPLVLRLEKGSALTPLEMDNNLRVLRDYANSLGSLFAVALNPDGTLKNPSAQYVTAAGGPHAASPSAYTITLTPVPAALADLTGKLLVVNFTNANFGAVTINPNGLGAVNVRKYGNALLESGDIKAGQIGVVVYDGTVFQYESWPGVVQPTNYAVDTGAVNALVVNQSGIIQAPSAYYDGYTVLVKVANTNTGASTLQVGGIAGAPPDIRKNGTGVLTAGDLIAGQVVQLVYAGSVFHLTGVGSRTLVHRTADTVFTATPGVIISDQPHGLGALIPDTSQLWFISKANTGSTGYAVGDAIPVESVLRDEDRITPINLAAFITGNYSVYSRFYNQNFLLSHKTTGASVPVTPAQFVADWNVMAVFTRIV